MLATRASKCFASLLVLSTALSAQEQQKELAAAKPAITAAATGQNVRFGSLAPVCQIRVVMTSTTGAVHFDSAWRNGNVLDWPIDTSWEALPSGSYRCVVMVKGLDGEVTEREATLVAREGVISIEQRDGASGLTIVGPDDEPHQITLLAHDGKSGSVVSASGDLTFRFGNFLAGTETERMRLTADGSLGIGTDKPEAPLDVRGLISTNEGVMFPDGTILTSAAGLPGAKTRAGTENPSAPVIGGGGGGLGGSQSGGGRSTPRPAAATPDYQFKVDATGVHIGTTSAYGLDVAGNVSLSSNLGLPATSSASAGVITLGGNRFGHGFGAITNTFLGSNAGNFTMTGSGNTATGSYALYSNTSGISNMASGYTALYNNTTGNRNTASGQGALYSNTTGYDNTANGISALGTNTTGHRNTASGGLALYSNTTGYENTANGVNALYFNTTGNANTANGAFALYTNTTGFNNTGNGWYALYSNTTGYDNTANGKNALFSNTTGYDNTANGENALYSNTTGFGNTANGVGALNNNTAGTLNTAHGNLALFYNTAGNSNTATGSEALLNSTSGSGNTANGAGALRSNTNGFYNTANGENALYSNTAGDDNTAHGRFALYSNTTGDNNTAVGPYALNGNTTGSRNVAIGSTAGFNLTTGDNNIHILNNGVAAESGTIRIGTSPYQTRAFMAGIRGVTTAVADAIAVVIDSSGQLGTVSSSRRYKTGIAAMGNATAGLMRLRPVTFRYLAHEDQAPLQYGLIAEEVAEIYPEMVTRAENSEPDAVIYQFLAPMLLNEVQQQRKTIEALEQRLERLEQELAHRR